MLISLSGAPSGVSQQVDQVAWGRENLHKMTLRNDRRLGGANSNIFVIFNPKLGEDEPILTSIFFKGVGSTTN